MPPKKRRKSVLRISVTVYVLVLLVSIIVALASPAPKKAPDAADVSAYDQEPEPVPTKHMISGVPVIAQEDLNSGCETYACTMLLQSLGFDITPDVFAEKYLICSPITYPDWITRYGPDMNSAFAGTVYNGYGIYAPAMAKSMNKYLKAQKSGLTATALKGIPLSDLCHVYIDKDIPVMVWATVEMGEPYEKATWIVDYVDENAVTKKGDTFSWYQGEHCLVLIGYDEDEYFFSDSCAGAVSHFDKELCEKRYDQLFTQGIVVE